MNQSYDNQSADISQWQHITWGYMAGKYPIKCGIHKSPTWLRGRTSPYVSNLLCSQCGHFTKCATTDIHRMKLNLSYKNTFSIAMIPGTGGMEADVLFLLFFVSTSANLPSEHQHICLVFYNSSIFEKQTEYENLCQEFHLTFIKFNFFFIER